MSCTLLGLLYWYTNWIQISLDAIVKSIGSLVHDILVFIEVIQAYQLSYISHVPLTYNFCVCGLNYIKIWTTINISYLVYYKIASLIKLAHYNLSWVLDGHSRMPTRGLKFSTSKFLKVVLVFQNINSRPWVWVS